MMNKLVLKVTNLLFLVSILIVVFACVDDDDNGNVIEGKNSIVDYVEKTPEFSLFYQILVKAQLDGVLDTNSGTYTFLTPNDEAIQQYLDKNSIASINDLSEEEAFNFVYYHILENITYKESFTTGYLTSPATVALTDTTTTGLSLYVNNENEVLFNGEVSITDADIELDNGIMHEIDAVLDLPTLQTFFNADPNFSSFYNEAITTSSIFSQAISSEDFYTLLVPSSESFTTYWANQNFSDIEKEQYFNYHIQDSLLITDNLETGYRNTLAENSLSNKDYFLSVYLNKEEGLLYNGITFITQPDVVATNGVIQGLDEALPLPTLADFINADVNLVSLQSAFTRTDQLPEDYINRLSSNTNAEIPFTVFAPIDTAFESVLLELYPAEVATLEDIPTDSLTTILNNHLVVNEAYDFEKLPNSVNTLESLLQISKTDSTFTIIDAKQRSATSSEIDIIAKNGIIHKIDSILLY